MIIKNGKRLDGMGDSMPIGSIVEYNGTDIPDGWEILPGDANVYIGPTQPPEGQEIWIQKGKNLANIETFIVGKTILDDGSENTNVNYRLSSFIEVKPSTPYILSENQTVSVENLTNGTAIRAVEFDEDKNFVNLAFYENRVECRKYSHPFTTTAKTKYIRFSQRMTDMETQLELGNTVTDYEPYIHKKMYVKNDAGIYEEFINIKNLGNAVVDNIKCKNIFTSSLQKGAYKFADGTFANSSSQLKNYLCTKTPINIIGGQELRLSLNYDSPEVGYIFYDSNDNFISSKVSRYAVAPLNATKCHVDILKKTDATEIFLSDITWIQLEVGGQPTSYVEPLNFGYLTGSNENGTWIKFSDGTLICSSVITTNNQNTDSHYQNGSWTYPATFIETPCVIATPKNWSTHLCTVKVNPTINTCSVLQQSTSVNGGLVDRVGDGVCLQAIGRWK